MPLIRSVKKFTTQAYVNA